MSWVYWGVLLATLVFSGMAAAYPKSRITAAGRIVTRPDPVLAVTLSLILITVAGLRHGTGTDYWVYYHKNVTEWTEVLNAFLGYKEPGIRLLSKVTRDLWHSGTGLIFVSALITVGIYCLMIYRHSVNYVAGMLIFLFLGDWTGSFNGVRQYLAAAILFAGHRLILKRRFVPYLLVVLLASMFHVSALIMIAPYFLLCRKPDWKQFLLMAAGAVIIRFSYSLIFDMISGYKGRIIDAQEEYMAREINPLRIAVCFIPLILYFFFCDRSRIGGERGFYINGLFFNAFTMLACMGSAYLGRTGIYTGAMVAIGYGHVFSMIRDERNRKLIVCISMIVLLVYWIYSVAGSGLADFHWIFERTV